MDRKLEGRIAIITGGAGGMGEATAILFAEHGASVAVVDQLAKGAEATASAIRAQGGTAIALAADVTSTADVRAVMDRTRSELGTPTILVNSAGVDLEGRIDIIDVAEEAFDRTIAVNLKGTWLTTKYVIPYMIAAGGGSIINISSVAALEAASSAGYCASKAGVVALSRVAAVELGKHNIRVNSLLPGPTETPMARHEREKLIALGKPTANEILDRMTVLGRMAQPIEMAKAALYLASDDASYATGAPFIVDGGMSSLSGARPI